MGFELDHVFICTEAGAEEAARLTGFGLTEGSPNVHTGQGTANRRFFFCNAYLELLWVHNPAKAQAEPTQRTRLWERWRDRGTGACPFGICLRPTSPESSDVPFTTWEYRPQYLPESLSLKIGTNSEVITEPLLVYAPFGEPPDKTHAKVEPMDHGAGLRVLRSVDIITPHASRMSVDLQAATETGIVRVRSGKEFLLELSFDGESKHERADFRPELPLAFRW